MTGWWRRLLHRQRLDRELEAELADHLERQARDRARAGLTEGEARRQSRLAFGGTEQIKEACRDVRGTRLLEELVTDVRYGGRLLRRSPGFTLASVTLLALGIGANTAIFTLLERALLRRVTVTAPGELYFVAHRSGNGTRTASNYPFLERVRSLDAFAGVTAYTTTSFKVSIGEHVDRVRGEYVAGNYHGLLGVPFRLGRGFSHQSDRSVATASMAVISDGYWTRRFARTPDVIGRTLIVDGRVLAIVGVTAPGFHGFTPGRPADLTLPLALKTVEQPDYLTMHDTWTSLPLVARLRAGVTESQASAALETVFRQYLSEPDNQWYKAGNALLLPADRGSDELRRRYATSLGVLMAMVALVLLIACANTANLLLARAAGRTKEVSLRLSMGASRGRLVRQLLTESLLLSLTGGALGYLIAGWSTRALAARFDVGPNPVILDVQPNLTVMVFAALASLVTGLAFGLAPAFRATRVELTQALKANGARIDRPRRRWSGRQLLVVGQIALCVLLVAGAGLLVRTLTNLQASNGSFDGNGVVLFSLDAGDAEFPLERTPAFCAALLNRLRRQRELVAASCSTSTPVDNADSRRGVLVEGTPLDGGAFASVITPDYFRSFGVRLLRGRGLNAQDSPTTPKVAIVNERFVRVALDGGHPLGRRFVFRAEPDVPITIVGVVRDVPQHSLREPAPPTVYTPLGQGGEVETFPILAVRSPHDPSTLTVVVRSAVREASPDVAVLEVKTLQQQLDAGIVRERLLATLSTWFGGLALTLACIGLYGVMSYEVTRRRRELGIRLALGAQPSDVLRLVVRQTCLLVAAGVLVGLVTTAFATRLLSTLLFGLSSRDPFTLTIATALLAATTLAAGYLPARRAARVDPTQALRNE